ncbi:MAG: hypothetical protein EI684_21470 [Candidatus Viridilinea halotolerans]|uniref:Uncharacterized protein n=1 Tax=Candidatus Viridilinea halotolerans TaxID=2491704 RepID=A0A426TRF7_9CHLR|nr:MAG: hypothetical protein EI684_21470 [Candidatus Viridilinea halotolerans]
MATNTSLTARSDPTYELLLVSANGLLRLWHDRGENPGYKIEHAGEVVWFRPPTRFQWRKDRTDALAMAMAMATDIGQTIGPPTVTGAIPITGCAPRKAENREHLAMLGRLYGEHIETAFAEEPALRRS